MPQISVVTFREQKALDCDASIMMRNRSLVRWMSGRPTVEISHQIAECLAIQDVDSLIDPPCTSQDKHALQTTNRCVASEASGEAGCPCFVFWSFPTPFLSQFRRW
jgi:hypothetical protein